MATFLLSARGVICFTLVSLSDFMSMVLSIKSSIYVWSFMIGIIRFLLCSFVLKMVPIAAEDIFSSGD